MALRPAEYQLVPLTKLLLNRRRGLLICDGVGVGKTISAGYILHYVGAWLGKANLVVCPPMLVDKWRLELIEKFNTHCIPIRSEEELGAAIDAWEKTDPEPPTYILTSSLLQRTTPPPFEGLIVFDEIHNFRNPDTKSWSSARALSSRASFCIGLSATPVNNSLEDLAAELSLVLRVAPETASAIVADLWRPHKRDALYSILTRFEKERLGIHFARREVMDHTISLPRAYMEEVRSLVKAFRGRELSESIRRDEITYYRLAASSAEAFSESINKEIHGTDTKASELDRVLSHHGDERVIVFCEFTRTAMEIAERARDRAPLLITGEVPLWERLGRLEAFRRSHNAVIVMTSVGAEGLDLQCCSVLVNYDLTWNPMVLEQRIGRIDRIGQEKAFVTIHNFVVQNSIDDRIIHTLARKLGLIEGSLLEVNTLLESHPSGEENLFSDEALADELTVARSLGSALEISESILPDDYQVLEEIRVKYCDPSRLATAGRTHPGEPIWLGSGDANQRWREVIDTSAGTLDSLVTFYS